MKEETVEHNKGPEFSRSPGQVEVMLTSNDSGGSEESGHDYGSEARGKEDK